ncbi:MAG: hypothetical protein ACRCYU_23360 [Nocardioides sp.]
MMFSADDPDYFRTRGGAALIWWEKILDAYYAARDDDEFDLVGIAKTIIDSDPTGLSDDIKLDVCLFLVDILADAVRDDSGKPLPLLAIIGLDEDMHVREIRQAAVEIHALLRLPLGIPYTLQATTPATALAVAACLSIVISTGFNAPLAQQTANLRHKLLQEAS